MDSGNTSGSMQSSSGGDEESYDSRAESSSISAFLNNPQPTHVGPFAAASTTSEAPNSTSHLNPLTHHNPMFDPLSSYLDPIQRSTTTLPNTINSPSLLNLDMAWSRVGRSEPKQPDLGGLMQLGGQTRGVGVAAFPSTQHSLPPQSANPRGLLDQQQALNTNNNNNNNTGNSSNNNNNMVRNPKKRSRASRRAPTTVLTTDTTNFRAMVQEFTGIPAPPFTSSPFPRTRLDLFGSVATSSSGTIRSHLDPPPYLLRPFAQKVQPFPQSTSCSIPPSSFPPSSSMVDTLLVPNNSTNSCANSTSNVNYQLSSSSSLVDHLGLLRQQPLNVNNMHNEPILSFQSILQQAPQPPRYPLGNSSPLLASKIQPSLEIPQTSAVASHLKMGVLEELGLSHAHVNTNVGGLHHQNMVQSSSDGALSTRVNSNNNNNDMHNSSVEWAQRTGRVTNNDGDHGGGVILRSLSGIGNYGSNIQERVSNGKVNFTASTPDFHGEKGPECAVAARSEGMVESWINCSSD